MNAAVPGRSALVGGDNGQGKRSFRGTFVEPSIRRTPHFRGQVCEYIQSAIEMSGSDEKIPQNEALPE
jgi:hypothetical protein